jgi:hypothetical protein
METTQLEGLDWFFFAFLGLCLLGLVIGLLAGF